jgi:hypothetical protein
VVELRIELVGQSAVLRAVQAFAAPDLNTSMATQITPDQIFQRIAARNGVKLGWIDDAQRAVTPYTVDVTGLTVANLQQRFAEEMHGRVHWCKDPSNCPGVFEVEALRHSGVEVGRTFRFATLADATLFKLRFPTAL